MVKKIAKYSKFVLCIALILSLVAPSYASLSASDGSVFVTKAEFDSTLADFNNRLTSFEAGINSKIDSQVTSYLDRHGIWSAKKQNVLGIADLKIWKISDFVSRSTSSKTLYKMITKTTKDSLKVWAETSYSCTSYYNLTNEPLKNPSCNICLCTKAGLFTSEIITRIDGYNNGGDWVDGRGWYQSGSSGAQPAGLWTTKWFNLSPNDRTWEKLLTLRYTGNDAWTQISIGSVDANHCRGYSSCNVTLFANIYDQNGVLKWQTTVFDCATSMTTDTSSTAGSADDINRDAILHLPMFFVSSGDRLFFQFELNVSGRNTNENVVLEAKSTIPMILSAMGREFKIY